MRLLSDRQSRPLKQKVVLADGGQVVRFRLCPLDDGDAVALLQAMQRVRNNLFHGGKEDAEDDPYAEDDEWAEATTAVAVVLIGLAQGHALDPSSEQPPLTESSGGDLPALKDFGSATTR